MQVRVFVIMEGGLIQNVLADDPDVVDVVVIDYDADGASMEDGIMDVPQACLAEPNESITGYAPALVSRWACVEIEHANRHLTAFADGAFGEGPA